MRFIIMIEGGQWSYAAIVVSLTFAFVLLCARASAVRCLYVCVCALKFVWC